MRTFVLVSLLFIESAVRSLEEPMAFKTITAVQPNLKKLASRPWVLAATPSRARRGRALPPSSVRVSPERGWRHSDSSWAQARERATGERSGPGKANRPRQWGRACLRGLPLVPLPLPLPFHLCPSSVSHPRCAIRFPQMHRNRSLSRCQAQAPPAAWVGLGPLAGIGDSSSDVSARRRQ
jgi:hypothetical protein